MVFLRSNQSWASHLGGHERLVGLGRIRSALLQHGLDAARIEVEMHVVLE
jgi:hypothetical protein